MAIPGNQAQGEDTVKERLIDLIRDWKRVEVGDFATLEEAEDHKRNLQHDINVILQRHPGMGDVALNHGYDEELLPLGAARKLDDDSDPPEAERAGSSEGAPDKEPNAGGNDEGGGGRGGGGRADNDRSGRLPAGTKIVRGPGGKLWVVTEVKHKGKTYYERWRLPGELKDHYGKVDKELTKAQLKRIPNNGLWRNSYGAGGRHPSAVWREEMADLFDISPKLLRDRDVVGVLIEAFHEKRDGAWILQELKQTKIVDSITEDRLDWMLNKSSGQKKDEIQRTFLQLKQAAEAAFGEVDYLNHFSDERLRQMAEKAASREKGWDADTAIYRIGKRAEKVAGTTASIQLEESRPNTENDIENKTRALREQAAEWMGWSSLPPAETIKRWATQILNRQRSDADFENWASQMAHGLHKWLGPNERFMDTQGTFKGIAEGLLGTTLSDDDRLLSDFTARDPSGKPMADQRMALYDYEDLVRNDPRYAQSDHARNGAFEFAGFLNEMFHGVPSGGGF